MCFYSHHLAQIRIEIAHNLYVLFLGHFCDYAIMLTHYIGRSPHLIQNAELTKCPTLFKHIIHINQRYTEIVEVSLIMVN
jgi:hypothetical protein